MDKIYAVVHGGVDDAPDMNTQILYEDFDEALEVARKCNELNYWDLSPQNQRQWEPHEGLSDSVIDAIFNLWTIGLTHPEVREIAETYMDAHGHWTDEDFGTMLINHIISECMTHGILPQGWAGIVEVAVNDEEED